jgi:O-antigen/teichoic acid export membrane protein
VVAVSLFWFPGLILKKDYSLHDVIIVAAISAVIMAIRCLRVPAGILLQAIGAFRQSAAIAIKTSGISLAATLILLLAFGPIASLGGVALGELAFLLYCRGLVSSWEATRG